MDDARIKTPWWSHGRASLWAYRDAAQQDTDPANQTSDGDQERKWRIDIAMQTYDRECQRAAALKAILARRELIRRKTKNIPELSPEELAFAREMGFVE